MIWSSILKPEFLQNLSQILIFVGVVVSALGGLGNYYFGDKVQALKANKAQQQENLLNGKIQTLVDNGQKLQDQLDPFIKMATQSYPNDDLQTALKKVQEDLNKVEELAKPPKLTYLSHVITHTDEGVTVELVFKPSKNEHLGNIVFLVSVLATADTVIKDLWPSLEGGAFQTGKDSKLIENNGKKARLIYSLISVGNPTIELKLSSLTTIRIEGTHGLEPFEINFN